MEFQDQKNGNLQRQIRLIATQTYIHEVKNRSGESSFGKLQKRFLMSETQINEEYWERNSRVFYKYANGKSVIKDTDLINKIETELPGVKPVLDHPLWTILENPFPELEEVHNLMRTLNPNIQTQLFQKNNKTNFYERKNWPYRKSFYHIDMLNNLDALACFLMLIREMELLDKPSSFTAAKWFALGVFLRLSLFAPLNTVAESLYEVIHRHFIDRNNSFASECKIHLTGKSYLAPSFQDKDTRQSINDKLSGILSKAKDHGFDMLDEQSQLKFLSWVFIYGLEKTHNAFNTNHLGTENQELINKLLSTYNSTNLRRDIPRYHVYTIFNPSYEH